MDRDIAGVPVPALLMGNDLACPPLDPDGIHHEAQPGEAHWICPPLRVTARFRNSANVNWGRIVEVQDPLGNWKSLLVLDCELGSNASGAVQVAEHRLRAAARKGARRDGEQVDRELEARAHAGDRRTPGLDRQRYDRLRAGRGCERRQH